MTSTDGNPRAAGRLDRSAQRYLAALLTGDRDGATEVVAETLAAGEPRAAVYAGVISRAMTDVGHLWSVDEIDVADEHMASEITADVLAQTAPPQVRAAGADGLAVVACVAPEAHGLGAQAVSGALRDAGWRVILFGTGTLGDTVVRYAGIQTPRVVALSVKTPGRVPAALGVAGRLKRLRWPPLVVLGGRAFRGADPGGYADVDLVTDNLTTAVSWLDGFLPRSAPAGAGKLSPRVLPQAPLRVRRPAPG